MRETAYQARLCDRLSEMFPGCHILRNDPKVTQGMPDLLILYGNTWAMLEVKTSEDAPTQPNQPYYIELFGQMSFAEFIFPENEEEVLYALQQAFGHNRQRSCVS